MRVPRGPRRGRGWSSLPAAVLQLEEERAQASLDVVGKQSSTIAMVETAKELSPRKPLFLALGARQACDQGLHARRNHVRPTSLMLGAQDLLQASAQAAPLLLHLGLSGPPSHPLDSIGGMRREHARL